MKTTQSHLKRIIKEELARVILAEGCGCGCGGVGGCSATHGMEKQPEVEWSGPDYEVVAPGYESSGEEAMDKEEALALVSRISQMTTCPVTQRALADVVEDLGHSDHGDEWNLGDLGIGEESEG